ncbi:MAG: DUF2917 domain-containing protein [Luteolibacter sp.]
MQLLFTQSPFGRWITRCIGKSVAPCKSYRLNTREQLQLKLRVGQHLSCLRGSLWVTLDGEDHILTAGKYLHLPQNPARVYIEALEGSVAAIKR